MDSTKRKKEEPIKGFYLHYTGFTSDKYEKPVITTFTKVTDHKKRDKLRKLFRTLVEESTPSIQNDLSATPNDYSICPKASHPGLTSPLTPTISNQFYSLRPAYSIKHMSDLSVISTRGRSSSVSYGEKPSIVNIQGQRTVSPGNVMTTNINKSAQPAPLEFSHVRKLSVGMGGNNTFTGNNSQTYGYGTYGASSSKPIPNNNRYNLDCGVYGGEGAGNGIDQEMSVGSYPGNKSSFLLGRKGSYNEIAINNQKSVITDTNELDCGVYGNEGEITMSPSNSMSKRNSQSPSIGSCPGSKTSLLSQADSSIQRLGDSTSSSLDCGVYGGEDNYPVCLGTSKQGSSQNVSTGSYQWNRTSYSSQESSRAYGMNDSASSNLECGVYGEEILTNATNPGMPIGSYPGKSSFLLGRKGSYNEIPVNRQKSVITETNELDCGVYGNQGEINLVPSASMKPISVQGISAESCIGNKTTLLSQGNSSDNIGTDNSPSILDCGVYGGETQPSITKTRKDRKKPPQIMITLSNSSNGPVNGGRKLNGSLSPTGRTGGDSLICGEYKGSSDGEEGLRSPVATRSSDMSTSGKISGSISSPSSLSLIDRSTVTTGEGMIDINRLYAKEDSMNINFKAFTPGVDLALNMSSSHASGACSPNHGGLTTSPQQEAPKKKLVTLTMEGITDMKNTLEETEEEEEEEEEEEDISYSDEWILAVKDFREAIERGNSEEDKEFRYKAFEKISSVSNNFAELATMYSRVILTEYANKKKTIEPIKMGGIVGGSKYKIFNNILFKLPKVEVDKGLRFPSYDAAAKVSGHELKSATHLFSAIVESKIDKNTMVPLMVLIDYFGHRAIAMTVLPIGHIKQNPEDEDGETTLIHGSDDGLKTLHYDEDMNNVLSKVGASLNLKGHQLVGQDGTKGQFWTPFDLEVHRSSDPSDTKSRYIIDLSRLFPSAQHNEGLDYLYRLFRPELVKRSRVPISSDWTRRRISTQEDREAAEELLNQLEGPGDDILPFKFVDSLVGLNTEYYIDELVFRLHNAGINLRYLGLVHARLLSKYPESEWCGRVAVEMITRSLRKLINSKLRNLLRHKRATDKIVKGFIIYQLNSLFGHTASTEETWNAINEDISTRFIRTRKGEMADGWVASVNDIRGYRLGGPIFTRKISEFLGLAWYNNIWAVLTDFSDTSIYEMEEPYIANSILSISPRVKQMGISHYARGYYNENYLESLHQLRPASLHVFQISIIHHFKTALLRMPSSNIYLRHYGKALEAYHRSLMTSTDLRKKSLIASFAEKIEFIFRALENETTDFSALFTTGDYYDSKGRTKKARELFKKALKIPAFGTGSSNACCKLADSLAFSDDPNYKEAEFYYREGLKYENSHRNCKYFIFIIFFNDF